MAKSNKKEAFRDRLAILIGEEKPYSWCRKVGIDKGLFQYYWQKGKIPTHENLIKIKRYMGCSLDWLLTGEGEPFPARIENIRRAGEGLIEEIDEMIYHIRKKRAEAVSICRVSR